MEITARVFICLMFALMIFRVRAEHNRNNSSIEAPDREIAELPQGTNRGGGGGGGSGAYGGGGCGWGWGGPGGSSGGGSGGGGAGVWKCQCKKQSGRRGKHQTAMMDFRSENYKMGEFAECIVSGKCKGMKLDCPLHCGGPCLYDCTHTCTPYCKT